MFTLKQKYLIVYTSTPRYGHSFIILFANFFCAAASKKQKKKLPIAMKFEIDVRNLYDIQKVCI